MLVGSMGAGKTTVGTGLARALGRPLVDNDRSLAVSGESAAGLARRAGLVALHRRECQELRTALASPTAAVVTAAASTVEDPACRAALAPHLVVWLRVGPDVAASRLPAGGSHRPDLGGDPAAALRALAARRDRWYAAVADVTVDVGDRPAAAVVDEVLDALGPAGTGERDRGSP
ncbi:MAG TPA: shikimate kinase [Acidimicrobiales bacterium]|nr:shikimate kinase [Acidimicrobiales bacterium]